MEDRLIKQNQQRLLLLNHSSKCEYNEKCPITQHCSLIKELWEHLSECSNSKDCNYKHCLSSKSVLIHYSICINKNCIICGPVRYSQQKNQIDSIIKETEGLTL